jgi:hypothetical protein
MTWRVLDECGNDLIDAERRRDPVRSILNGAVLVVAMLWVGGSAIALALGGTAVLVLGVLFAVCMATVLLLAPVVVLRRQRPVRLRASTDGRDLLRVECSTRLGIASVRYDVVTPAGGTVGSLVQTPLPGAAWRIELPDGTSGKVRSPSPVERLWWRTVRSVLLVIAGARLVPLHRRAVEWLRAPQPGIVATIAGRAEPLARCVPDPEGEWTWLLFGEGTGERPPLRTMVLVACLLIIGQESL